jgi:hypothetical protein
VSGEEPRHGVRAFYLALVGARSGLCGERGERYQEGIGELIEMLYDSDYAQTACSVPPRQHADGDDGQFRYAVGHCGARAPQSMRRLDVSAAV